MACNKDLVQYIADQCADAGTITTKRMFGDYGIYCNGKIFGLICDDKLYVKQTEDGRKMLLTKVSCPPYEGARDYFLIREIDDHGYLGSLVRATCQALRK